MKRALVMTVAVVLAWPALAGLPTNVAAAKNGGTAYPVKGLFNSDGAALIDEVSGHPSQLEFTGWAAVVWDTPRTLDRIIVEMSYPNYVIPEYKIQIANAGVLNPDPLDDAHWTTVSGGHVVGVDKNSFPSFAFTPGWATAGVRFLAVDTVGPAGSNARLREIWAFENYNNLALDADFSAPGWNPVAGTGFAASFNDECTTAQFKANTNGASYVYATFTDLVTLDASCITGGGMAGEYLLDYNIEYWDYTLNGGAGDWAIALTVRNSPEDPTRHADWRTFDVVATSDQWRLYCIASNGGGQHCVSEIMLFAAAVPEPATMTLLALGGLALLRRKR